MVILFLAIFLLCFQQNIFLQTSTLSTEWKNSTEVAVSTEILNSLEGFMSEEELMEEASNTLDTVEPKTEGTTTEGILLFLQEDESFLEESSLSPLDLNTASYLQLKTIPGLTPEIASAIVKKRQKQPFSSKSELKKIRGVTDEVYKKISPYITVHKVKQPAKLKGLIRLRTKFFQADSYEYVSLKTNYVPVEKFKQPWYFYNISQFSYGERLSLGYVFLHKPFEIEVNFETFQYFLRKWWLRLNTVGLFEKILIGNYKAGFGHGLVFHESVGIGNLVDTIKPKMCGLREDKSSYDNAYFYGIGIEGNSGMLEYSIFYSNKQLITKTIISSMTVRDEITGEETTEFTSQPSDDLLNIRNSMIEYDKYLMDYDINVETSTFGRLPKRKVYEELVGINLTLPVKSLKLGICGYHAQYNKPFDPDKTRIEGYDLQDKYSEKWRYTFRGDNLSVYSVYFDFPLDKLNIYGEVAESQCWFKETSTQTTMTFQRGRGLNLGVILPVSKTKFYLLYTYLEPTFYSPLGSPIRVYGYYNNQQGIEFATEYVVGKFNINFSYSTGELFKGIWSGYSGSESPRFPSKYNEFFLETKYKPVEGFKLTFRTLNDLSERYVNLKTYGISNQEQLVQTDQLRLRNSYQVTCDVSKDVRLRFRYDQKWQSFIKYNKLWYGEQLWAELVYKFWNFTINSRFCIFDTDNVDLSYLEQQWYNLYISETENNSKGDKFCFSVAYKFRKNIVLWSRYRYKIYAYKNEISTWIFTSLKDNLGLTDHEYRLQLDISW